MSAPLSTSRRARQRNCIPVPRGRRMTASVHERSGLRRFMGRVQGFGLRVHALNGMLNLEPTVGAFDRGVVGQGLAKRLKKLSSFHVGRAVALATRLSSPMIT